MRISEDKNGCCTLINISSMLVYEVYRDGFNFENLFPIDNEPLAWELFLKELKRLVQVFDNRYGSSPYLFKDRAVVMCTTTTVPENGKRFLINIIVENMLERFGFKRVVGPVKKNKHPESALSVWVMTTGDFLSSLENNLKEIQDESV